MCEDPLFDCNITQIGKRPQEHFIQATKQIDPDFEQSFDSHGVIGSGVIHEIPHKTVMIPFHDIDRVSIKHSDNLNFSANPQFHQHSNILDVQNQDIVTRFEITLNQTLSKVPNAKNQRAAATTDSHNLLSFEKLIRKDFFPEEPIDKVRQIDKVKIFTTTTRSQMQEIIQRITEHIGNKIQIEATPQLAFIPKLLHPPSTNMTKPHPNDTSGSIVTPLTPKQQKAPKPPTVSSDQGSAKPSTSRQESNRTVQPANRQQSRLFAIKCGDYFLSGGRLEESFSVNKNGFQLKFDFSQSTEAPHKVLIDAALCFEEGFKESLQQSMTERMTCPFSPSQPIDIAIPFNGISAIYVTQLFPSNPAERKSFDATLPNDSGKTTYIIAIFQITLNPVINQISRKTGPITIVEFENIAKQDLTKSSNDGKINDTQLRTVTLFTAAKIGKMKDYLDLINKYFKGTLQTEELVHDAIKSRSRLDG
ncbi:hypothetical protein BLNAU_19302 [Blattamonas nauphoetae]|uniref:Uncharacterized protein n=1 Tax=Blattamonas nauphoetae TaxID=2049346 RepID=A0ABQ9X521_9EUKA|nr:hypothetical protein BLNAU_19302 [Blattamonas nauphoetae]